MRISFPLTQVFAVSAPHPTVPAIAAGQMQPVSDAAGCAALENRLHLTGYKAIAR